VEGPARVAALLALVAAMNAPGAVAAASDRFIPKDPAFVVANVARFVPDDELRPMLEAWQADRHSSVTAVALANAFIERARNLREPAYFGRAEAVLAPLIELPHSGSAPRRLYATVLQFRHEFAAAEEMLDGILLQDSRDVSARTLRASVRLVRGDFAGARGDCAQLAGGGEIQIGLACLAEALAGSGDLERALGVLASVSSAESDSGYVLAVRAELRERAGDDEGAIADYRAALAAAPGDDSIRAALADLLSALGRFAQALEILDVERPSLALVVRQAIAAPAGRRGGFETRADEWLSLETARGDAIHFREAALLALSRGDAARALEAARANFENQRELADVRVFARAAVAARDDGSLGRIGEWLVATGFRDVVTEKVLGPPPRG
jgi:thioredoxin-like negative regulator of GroEL